MQNGYCILHGEGGHDTKDCFRLNKEVKRLKKESGNDDGGKSHNKTWSRKAAESNEKSKNDLAAFIRKEAKKVVKKDLKAFNKKRKNSGDDTDSELDLNAFDLKDFNYEDMANLKIDDEDSVSV